MNIGKAWLTQASDKHKTHFREADKYIRRNFDLAILVRHSRFMTWFFSGRKHRSGWNFDETFNMVERESFIHARERLKVSGDRKQESDREAAKRWHHLSPWLPLSDGSFADHARIHSGNWYDWPDAGTWYELYLSSTVYWNWKVQPDIKWSHIHTVTKTLLTIWNTSSSLLFNYSE